MDHFPPAIFLGDALALDFLNSIATPVDIPVDWLGDGEALLRWLDQARLVPAEVLKDLREQALPGELDTVADQARSLREWFRGFVLNHKGRKLGLADPRDLAPLNRLLERDEAYSRILIEDGAPRLKAARRWRSPEALLLPIGEALARLVSDEDFAQIKSCEGHACTLIFADHTRSRARRWCSMALCGNRAKQAAHRERAKAHHH